MIDAEDMEEDPLAEQRAELARIIMQAQRWAHWSRLLFATFAALNLLTLLVWFVVRWRCVP